MKCDPIDTDRINSFALVSYIPGALGEFLDRLREELVVGCNPHAHVTLLTPRPLLCDFETSHRALEQRLGEFSPFQVELDGVKVFEETSVIYLGIGRGRSEILDIHEALNDGPLAYAEPFPFHPHVTLVQGVDSAVIPELFELAKRRWRESAPATGFAVDRLTFVQNTAASGWIDLSEVPLRPSRFRRLG